MTTDPYQLLCSLVLEDGRRWGEAAAPFQIADAKAFLDGPARRHNWLRPRGSAKSTDAGALLLVDIICCAGPRSRSYLLAVDEDQAALILDAMVGLIYRTKGLPVKVEANRIVSTNPATIGASVQVLSSDAASAFGLRPRVVVLDEVCQWPETANHRRLMSAMLSSLPKVADSKLIVCSTPGDPSHPTHALWERTVGDSDWHTSHVAGPTPWWSERDVEAARRDLMPAEFKRLVLCEWASDDDKLTTRDDILALVHHERPLEPVKGVKYVVTLDVGTRNDSTAVVVSHLEDGPLVVVDRVMRWSPRKGVEVDLRLVRDALTDLSHRYNRAPVVYDPSQAVKLAQDLSSDGVVCSRFDFTVAAINRAARGLYGAIRDRLVAIPDDREFVDELAGVLFVERSPGQYRIDHRAGRHDDQAVALMLGVDHWIGGKDFDRERQRKAALECPPGGVTGPSHWRHGGPGAGTHSQQSGSDGAGRPGGGGMPGPWTGGGGSDGIPKGAGPPRYNR